MTSTLGIKKIQYPNGTNSITIDSSGSADITTANITTANVTNATATGTITTPSINGTQIGGRRNIVINGAMQVAQRGTSQASISSAGYYTIDRFKINTNNAGVWTMSQEALSSSDTPFTVAGIEVLILILPLSGNVPLIYMFFLKTSKLAL